MSLVTDYFAAADDERAATVAVGGPEAVDPVAVRRPFVSVRVASIDPFVALGTLTALLTDRPYAEVVRHPRHGTLVASVGDEGPWVVSVSEELVSALAGAAPGLLDRVARRWAGAEEVEGAEPGALAATLHALASLCVRADDTGERLYCWTSL
ncbi:hypothetical protein [Cellulosimicrobium marinum]|uniref:hypothetical protein n=1 Tax=Cellulosimicrobium marinum TaxID=1638992 RepID=UPI001E4481AC|nr:hypothetical protein [Cellulosimicrobium marinum]MCB7137721.1 hypothetical protein [Cellulosimicrobium marinum]